MTEGNFIAAEFFRLTVKMSSPHFCTKVTRVFFGVIGNFKNICFKYSDRDIEKLCIAFNFLSVDLIISRIHHKENKVKRNITVTSEHLHKLCHQHGILAARNTDSDLITALYQFIIFHSLDKAIPDRFAVFFCNALFDFLIGF